MRSALLSTLELTPAGNPRAFERLGGRTLIAWQVDLARELGCSRIICLAEQDTDPFRELRETAEGEGLEFHLVRGPLPLVSLLSADQELVVIADGLVVDRARVMAAMGKGRGVAALPAEEGLAAGFERIDAEHAWGGVLVARANIAAQLADMPPDSDTISLLLRLALQAGTKLVSVGNDAISSGEWLLVADPAALVHREEALLDRSVEAASWTAPGDVVSRRLARLLAPEALSRGPLWAQTLGGLAIISALTLAHFATPFAGLLVFAAGVLAVNLGAALKRLGSRLRGIGLATGRTDVLNNTIDLALLALLSAPIELETALQQLFLPLMFMSLLRLAERLAPKKWQASWADRALLAALLLPAAWFNVIDQVLAGFCLVTVASCLFFGRKIQITRA